MEQRINPYESAPGAALNRVFAYYKVYGPRAALTEAEKLQYDSSHFYFLLLGELYEQLDREKARISFEKAWSLAKTQTEKQGIRKRIDALA